VVHETAPRILGEPCVAALTEIVVQVAQVWTSSDAVNPDRFPQRACGGPEVLGTARDNKVIAGDRSGEDRCVHNLTTGRARTGDSCGASAPLIKILDAAASWQAG
jgi:hypothetical protein